MGRAAAAGALLGFWQWVKFGGAVYAAASLVLVDLLILACRPSRADFARWVRTSAVAAAAAAGFEVALVAWAFATLPAEVAWDVVWPDYTGQLYTSMPERYPSWYGWRYFVLRQSAPAAGLLTSLAAGAWLLRELRAGDRTAERQFGLLVPTAFLILGVGTYLGHVYVYRMYAWCVAPAVAIVIARRPRVWGPVYFALWLPCNYFAAREAITPAVRWVPATLPDGHRVDLEPAYFEAYQALAAETRRLSGDPAAAPLIMPVGSGFYAHHGLTPPTRNTWLLPHYVRPYDEPALLAAADRVPFVAFVGVGSLDERATFGELVGPALGPRVTAAFQARIREEVRVNSVCRLYRLR